MTGSVVRELLSRILQINTSKSAFQEQRGKNIRSRVQFAGHFTYVFIPRICLKGIVNLTTPLCTGSPQRGILAPCKQLLGGRSTLFSYQ
jgi:hypothetical protein